MVGENGKAKPGKKPGKLTYFFLNGDLHKSLFINRGEDKIITWCYPLAKRVAYTYSDTKKYREPAFTTKQTGKMLNRGHLALERAILRGHIEEPPYTYTLDENRRKYKYMWHEKNILEAHAYFCTVHFGRPRNDGLIRPLHLPTVKELRAMIRQDQVLYVLNDDGDFVPVWRAKTFD